MNIYDDREIVLYGNVKGCKDIAIELELYDHDGLNIVDVLFAEGTVLLDGQEDLQVACADSHGPEELVTIISGLGDRAVSDGK